MTTAQIELYRTATGTRLHIPACYHVHGTALVEASEEDRATLRVCTWCQAEIDGEGRTRFATLREALEDFGAYRDTWATVEKALADVEHDEVWVPNSRSYVALGLDGRGVAWLGKTYVQRRDGRFLALPGYAPGGGGGARRDVRYGELCEDHWLVRSLTGRCPACD